jgi:adenosylmethionine-8-amino-7-oxononanoate aminotransferase
MDPALRHLLELDRQHVWHPYATMPAAMPPVVVESAQGARLRLADGRELIDGMASWWAVIHGYRHPELDAAITRQLSRMAHVMFGGITHEPAVLLARELVELAPEPLSVVFFADSGSVAMEVAMKMAFQYWMGRGRPEKCRLVALRGGYHGDTLGAMSVCDPENGMHAHFARILPQHLFVPRPAVPWGAAWDDQSMAPLEAVLARHGSEIAALVLEPVVQGAGGMYFYHPQFLRAARRLCDAFDVLLIADEIATGFGRTGRMFACEHAGISPDIMAVGKALTGGYLTLGAVLATAAVAQGVNAGGPGCLMHGPTFMANPLACAVARASLELVRQGGWRQAVSRMEALLREGLAPCQDLPHVAEVRVLGGIGVVELTAPVHMAVIQPALVHAGVWVRPFGRLVYVMPPYVISEEDLVHLCQAVVAVVAAHPPA